MFDSLAKSTGMSIVNGSSMIVHPQGSTAVQSRNAAKLAEVKYRDRVTTGFKKLSNSLQRVQKDQRKSDGLVDKCSIPQLLDLASCSVDAMLAELAITAGNYDRGIPRRDARVFWRENLPKSPRLMAGVSRLGEILAAR